MEQQYYKCSVKLRRIHLSTLAETIIHKFRLRGNDESKSCSPHLLLCRPVAGLLQQSKDAEILKSDHAEVALG
jgi:hypothetical protein